MNYGRRIRARQVKNNEMGNRFRKIARFFHSAKRRAVKTSDKRDKWSEDAEEAAPGAEVGRSLGLNYFILQYFPFWGMLEE